MPGRFGAIPTDTSLAAGQSVRRNAADNGFEAYAADGSKPYLGFPYTADGGYEVTISYSDANRQVTITPDGATFDVWISGVKYTFTGVQTSTAHADTTDEYFIYYDESGVLTTSTTPWNLLKHAPVCSVTYNATTNIGVFPLFELHTAQRDPELHYRLHFGGGTVLGTRLGRPTFSGTGTPQFTATAVQVLDEDIELDTDALDSTSNRVVYLLSSAEEWTEQTNTFAAGVYTGEGVKFLNDGTDICFNEYVGGAWQKTPVSNNSYTNMYLMASTHITASKRYWVCPAQAEYGTLNEAQNEAPASLSFPGTSPEEYAFVARITYSRKTSNGANNLFANVESIAILDGAKTSVLAGAGVTAHSALSGLQGGTAGEYYHLTAAEYGSLGGGAFTDLTDVPASYTGQTGKFVKVNAGETALEFAALAGGGDLLSTNNLSDLANTATARTNLGLGTVATQAANDVSITAQNNGLSVKDTGNDHALTLRPAEDLTANRTLSVITNDASRSLTIAADATISGTNSGDQTITLTGDVTGTGTGSFAATIANDAVTYAKIQNVSATARALGRNTAGSGDIEEISLTQILDWIGSAAQGDILYRGAANWTRLGAGTVGQYLKTGGTGADPSWGYGAVIHSSTSAGATTTGANTTPVSVTNAVFTYTTSAVYRLWVMGRLNSAAATTGAALQFDLSSAVTAIDVIGINTLAAAGTVSGFASVADDTSLSTSSGVPAGPVDVPIQAHGLLVTGANTGTCQLRIRSETTAVTELMAGAVFVVERVA